jgi:paraquat-inducible protein B
VEHVNISLDGQSVEFVVFINKLYVPYVHRSSKFWVKSAVEVGFVDGSLDINVAPLTHLVQGGIEFSSRGEDISKKVPDTYVFPLYKNANLAEGQVIGRGGDFVNTFEILTEDSIAKLKKGAQVQYEGYEVGRVKDIALSYNGETHKIVGRVLVDIDLSSFASKQDDITSCQEKFNQALEEGLSAKISSKDPFTGTLFVDLVFDMNTTQRTLIQGEQFVRLPAVPNDATGIVEGVEKLVASLSKVVDDNAEPIQKIVADLQQSVNNLNAMTETKAFKTMPDELNKTMKELTTTLRTAKKVLKEYDSNSLLTHQIAQTLKEVTETSQEMEEFLKMLNRKPNSLIFGDQ